MDIKRPLIFVHPLTQSLSKLKETLQATIVEQEENKSSNPFETKKNKEDKEGEEEQEIIFEIYEVDQLNEVSQLIQTIGPSLTLVSSPKKCAQILQDNTKYIKKFNSKILLLSKTDVPSRVTQKLKKMGLTEDLTEPIVPKSLLYKVNLLIKSLPTLSDKEDEENQTAAVVIKRDEKTTTKNDNEAQRLERGLIIEESSALEDLRNDSSSTTLTLVDDNQNPNDKKSDSLQLVDDSLSLANKKTTALDLIDDSDPSSGNRNTTLNLVNVDTSNDNLTLDIENDPEVLALKNELNTLEITDDSSSKKDTPNLELDDSGLTLSQETTSLNLIDNDHGKKKKQESLELSDARPLTTAEIENGLNILDEKDTLDKIMSLDIEEDMAGIDDSSNTELTLTDDLKKTKDDTTSLNLEADDQKHKNRNELELTEDGNQNDAKATELILDETNSNKNKTESTTLELINQDDVVNNQELESNLSELKKIRSKDQSNLELIQDNKQKNTELTLSDSAEVSNAKDDDTTSNSWEGLIVNNEAEFELDYTKKKKNEISISWDISKSSEQTIDYGRLKKEFEEVAISMSTPEKIRRDDTHSKDFKDQLNQTSKLKLAEEEDTSDNDVIGPDSKGFEHLIPILNMYLNKEVNNENILLFTMKQIYQHYNGVAVILSYNNTTNDFAEEVVGHNVLQTEKKWEDEFNTHIEDWKRATLPTWSDSSFQASSNQFVYPFMEGANKIGVGIVFFYSKLEEKNSNQIEVLLESSRGILLEKSHNLGTKGKYLGTSSKNKKDNEKKEGFFATLFGKLKAS